MKELTLKKFKMETFCDYFRGDGATSDVFGWFLGDKPVRIVDGGTQGIKAHDTSSVFMTELEADFCVVEMISMDIIKEKKS